MSARDRLTSVNIAPGSIVKTAYFNLSTASSMEYNVDDENQRRSEHSIVDFVVTIPTFYDDDFEVGYVAADALEVSRNSGDTSKIDINAGLAYIGGRRYKQINNNTAYDLTGSSNALYYIRMKYTLSTSTFVFIVETSESGDTASVKYLTLASATWNETSGYWENDFLDLRSTNTSLPPPITFAGTSANPILTIEQEGTGLGLKVVGNAGGGDVIFFDSTNPRKIDVYGDGSNGITIHNAALYSVTLTADNSNRLLVSNDIKATAGYFGSAPIIISGTTIQDFQTLEFKTSATVSGSGVTSIGFTSMDFTSVGAIGAASLDATGNVQGSILISDIAIGTAPLTVTSTTIVPNLNADRVDGYHFTGASGSVSASAAELNNLDGYTGDLADLNRIIEAGRAQGDILRVSAADTLGWLAASDGVLKSASGVLSWDNTPDVTGLTVAAATGVTFDGTGTDPIITAAAGGGSLYFGDTIQLSDKASSPSWTITGAGAGTFVSVSAPTITAGTTLSVTSGPSLTSSGIATAKALTGVTTISGTGAWATTSTIDFSGIVSGATKAELNNAADATGRLKGDLRYASADVTLGWLGIGGAGQVLKVTSGAPAWEDFGTYDNYSSWTYKLDGFDQDAVGSAQTLEFVSGSDMNITDSGTRQMTFNVLTTSTAADADTTPITANWAYDHAVGETINLHTKLGTITSGTWQGTDIAAAYLGAHSHTSSDTGGDYAWADITGGISSTPTDAATTTAISSNWSYDHAVGQTVNLHTKLGTVSSGVWQGSAITNTYLSSFGAGAQLDQDCKTTADVKFDSLRLSGGTTPPAANEIVIESVSGTIYLIDEDDNHIKFRGQTLPTGMRITTNYGDIVFENNVKLMDTFDLLPETAGACDIGTEILHFGYVWADYLRYDENSQSFDHVDDLAIIDALGPSDKTDSETGLPMMDNSALPDGVKGEGGFIDAQNYNNFLAGGIKQLHKKVKDQDRLIGALMDKIEELEVQMNERHNAG